MFRLFSRRRRKSDPAPDNTGAASSTAPAAVNAQDAPEPLLEELESLQAALHTRPSVDLSMIPILDDILESSPDIPAQHSDGSDSPDAQNAEFQHEILIQEVLDELMPTLEAALRRRLLDIDQALLREWQSKHDDSLNMPADSEK